MQGRVFTPDQDSPPGNVEAQEGGLSPPEVRAPAIAGVLARIFALGGSSEPQRRFTEIGCRHFINELHDAVLPPLSNFQEVGVVFTKM
jgi:hypothetical protein